MTTCERAAAPPCADAVVERESALRVRFYGNVTPHSAARFQRCLAEACAESVMARVPGEERGPPVVVLLQSDGGDVFSGLACLDALESAAADVVVVAEGVVASAATFLLLGARRRIARANACVQVHQASTRLPDAPLRPEEMRDEACNAEALAARLRALYVERTSMSPQRVDSLLRREVYLDAAQALEDGVVDEVV